MATVAGVAKRRALGCAATVVCVSVKLALLLIRLAEDLHRRSEFCAILWANMMVICVSVGLSGDVAVTAKACQ